VEVRKPFRNNSSLQTSQSQNNPLSIKNRFQFLSAEDPESEGSTTSQVYSDASNTRPRIRRGKKNPLSPNSQSNQVRSRGLKDQRQMLRPTSKNVSYVTTSGKNENAEISKAVGPTIPVILGSSPQSTETDPLDPETCYDSDYERLNRSVDMDSASEWSDMLDKQESELLRLFSRSSSPVPVGNFVQVLRLHLKFKI